MFAIGFQAAYSASDLKHIDVQCRPTSRFFHHTPGSTRCILISSDVLTKQLSFTQEDYCSEKSTSGLRQRRGEVDFKLRSDKALLLGMPRVETHSLRVCRPFTERSRKAPSTAIVICAQKHTHTRRFVYLNFNLVSLFFRHPDYIELFGVYLISRCRQQITIQRTM